ncbi:MAG: polysaccharide deacetylase family protein, partial [Actinomycetota bacterium]|nr:polysaccharide deacetylase family protein [Actinomycetota bacterium]
MGRRLLVVLAVLGLLAVPATPAPGSPQGVRIMYLTFDDGPNPLFTPIVLRLLEQHAAGATFFPTGQTLNLFWGNEEVQDLLDRGHAVGSHSWAHHRLSELSQFDLERDLTRASSALEDRTGF